MWASGVMVALRRGGNLLGYGKIFRDRTDAWARTEEAANTADRLKQALGTVAHELRNQLATLANVAGVLRRGGADAAFGPGQPRWP